MQNKNTIRILLATGLGVLLWTALYWVLPKAMVVHVGYGFGLLGMGMVAGTLLRVARSTKGNYIPHVAFPLVALRYGAGNLLLTGVVLGLVLVGKIAVPWVLFTLLHAAFLAWYLWKFLAMEAGREAILATGEKAEACCENWKSLCGEAEILVKTAPAQFQKEISQMRDAVRYADPVSHPSVAEVENRVRAALAGLKESLAKNEEASVSLRCQEIQAAVQERNVCLKSRKP